MNYDQSDCMQVQEKRLGRNLFDNLKMCPLHCNNKVHCTLLAKCAETPKFVFRNPDLGRQQPVDISCP